MKINKKEIKYIERTEIYGNYFDYLKPIMEYYINVYGYINEIYKLEEFIDNITINGYGFVEYNGKLYIPELYIPELLEDSEQLQDYDYFIDSGDKYILIPVE